VIVHRKQLRSVSLQGGEIRRNLVTIEGHPLVLFHKSHPMLQPRFRSRADWRAFVRRAQATGPARDEALAWNRGLRFQFNCHTLAVGAFFGLSPNDWLEGSRSLFTLMENPAETLLHAFFREQEVAPIVDELPTCAREDDVVIFSKDETGEMVHSGRVKCASGTRVILSKLGEHPAVLSTLKALTEEYDGQYDRVRLFRCEVPDLTPRDAALGPGTPCRSPQTQSETSAKLH
jgi:hypothetical protein